VTAAGDDETVIHASAVAIGDLAILIRGKAGSGKSSLAMALIDDPRSDGTLIGDDRVLLTRQPTGVIVRPQPALAGLIEVRGIGILPIAHREKARLAFVVDLLPEAECPRLPDDEERKTMVLGHETARLALPIGATDASLRIRLALRQWIGLGAGSSGPRP
jgi:serine kinase of HPr protein (carbohydrate metabolism regulator)